MPTLKHSIYNVKARECGCKRTTHQLFSYELWSLNRAMVYTHASCVCNEIAALHMRHQVDDGSRYTSKLSLKVYLRPLIQAVLPVSQETIISHCSGDKRSLMLAAQESLLTKSITKSDATVKMFLKDDKYVVDYGLGFHLNQSVSNKIAYPRCIQYRNKRYCLQLATYLHPIEKMVYSHCDSSGTPIFAKCRNLSQRGGDLRAKWDSFEKPIAYLLDHSKFDAHVSVQLLALATWFHTSCNSDPILRELLEMQVNNRGYTKNGTSYRTRGTRMSGDQNTGLDNSIINYAMLASWVAASGVRAQFYVDGDDSVIIADRPIDIGVDHFLQFGMVTKMDCTQEFEQVEFCQTRPVFDGVSWRCVRNPYRIISRTPWMVGTKWLRKVPDYLYSIGLCEQALNMGLPVAQYLAKNLVEKFSGRKRVRTHLDYVANREYVRPGRARFVAPTYECRLSFARAWGISPSEQESIEAGLALRCPEIVEGFDNSPFKQ